ncbi:MAG: Non-reducing end beta-L-arabinofuranosidase [bacterium]|nr:Non-reducing end beta-L-arabinofuranosidase [bacterium]
MTPAHLQKLSPVPPRQVEINDGFWAPKLKTNREVTIPTVYQRCRETGRIDAWKLDWKPGQPQTPHVFWDSDVAKWIEAAAHSLATHPDPKLETTLDDLIDTIAKAQQPDGYLNTHFTAVRPDMRWKNLRDWHELYCAGHLIEAAVAYFHATGKKKFLDTVCRCADHIDRVFGTSPGQKRGYPGHEEIELALVKLYQATGERRYLQLAKYFIDERGQQPHYFDVEARERGEDPASYWAKTHEYTQSHLPVREQKIPVGHAVRGMYLYSAMVDLAVECQDHELLAAGKRLWQHLVHKRMYVTGGIGSSRANEGHTADYDLPNETAYAETCAAIGLVLFTHRLLQIEPDTAYADVIERALYNVCLSGVSLTGARFFYENPLESRGNHQRWEWHECSCCPPNIARLLATLGQYIYSQNAHAFFVHLYIGGNVTIACNGETVRLTQQSNYPWDGKITFRIASEREVDLTLALRLPGWCRAAEIKVNGEEVAIPPRLEKGYAKIHRRWQSGDQVELNLFMPIERVQAHPQVRANCGRIALQRGPLVYCLEEIDNGKNLNDLVLCRDKELAVNFESDFLGGVSVITGAAKRRQLAPWQEQLYRADLAATENIFFKAIPYFAWANRAPGEMLVWLREACYSGDPSHSTQFA